MPEELTPYEKLAILREEIETWSKEQQSIERRIRDLKQELERRKFLWSIFPDFYRNLPPPEGAKELPELEQKKAMLDDLLSKLRSAQAQIEANPPPPGSTAAPQPPPRPASQRRHRFASFDDFQPGGTR